MAWFQRIFRDLSWTKNRREPFPLSVHHYASAALPLLYILALIHLTKWPCTLSIAPLRPDMTIPPLPQDWFCSRKQDPLSAGSDRECADTWPHYDLNIRFFPLTLSGFCTCTSLQQSWRLRLGTARRRRLGCSPSARNLIRSSIGAVLWDSSFFAQKIDCRTVFSVQTAHVYQCHISTYTIRGRLFTHDSLTQCDDSLVSFSALLLSLIL